MKSVTTVTIDTEILNKARELSLNISGVANDALKAAIGVGVECKQSDDAYYSWVEAQAKTDPSKRPILKELDYRRLRSFGHSNPQREVLLALIRRRNEDGTYA